MSGLERLDTEQIVVAVVTDLIQDWDLELDGDIAGGTRLVGDLEFASVDIIQLCVALEQRFDQKFGFHDLLMENGSYVDDLPISRIADFIVERYKNREIEPA